MNAFSRSLVVTLLAGAAGACGRPQDTAPPPDARIDEQGTARSTHRPPDTSNPYGIHPTYFGGPVLQNVRVVSIFWGPNVKYAPELNSFYQTITSSAYFEWLIEYNTAEPRQLIGPGSLWASAVDPAPPAGGVVRNEDIQREILRLIGNGTVPTNDPNTLYMVHFPPDISVSFDGTLSCADYCAYHSTFRRDKTNVYYGVIPDMGGKCANSCGPGNSFSNTTAVASHELVESVTDPAVDLAADYAAPLGWYDRSFGEIGDICNAQQDVVAGFTVQRLWSNSQNRCRAF